MDQTKGLRLTTAQWQAVCDHLARHLPEEACGLLAGQGGVVRAVHPVENRLHSPTAYAMDPAQQIETMVSIEDAGWEITGIFHSHPAGPPTPSPTDIAQAYYPESVYLICAPDEAGAWRGRAFRIEAGRVTETPLVIGE